MIYAFGDCELDIDRFELRRRGVHVHVEPQVFDVLAYLVAHRGRVVSRDELLSQVWGHSYVSDATLSSRLMSARKAIGDSGRNQSLIRTIRGRGYQFAGAVTERVSPAHHVPASPVGSRESTEVIGREGERADLHGLLGQAVAGARDLVIVSGEAGAGKTTLVECFLEEAAVRNSLLVGRGRCLDYHGAVEPYMPVLEAFGRLCRGPAGPLVVNTLLQLAPTWVVQMPWVVGNDEFTTARDRALGAGHERMLREIVEGLEALCAVTPVVLFLDDLHWADRPTLGLLAHLARRDEPARLLIVGTSRPESRGGVDELRRELRPRGRCVELALPPFSRQEVQRYLEVGYRGAEELASLIHERTNGNPLFMECLLQSWVDTEALVREGSVWRVQRERKELAFDVPDTLRDLLERELAELTPEDVRILEAAAAVGTEFSAAAATAGAGLPDEEVEERCSELARRGRFLQARGVDRWPDGTVAAGFRFIHDLHRHVLYERIPAGRRVRMHRDIAARLEAGYGNNVAERATELATHFLEAREPGPAARYLQLAAEQAIGRGAHQDAIGRLRTALELIPGVPDPADRDRRELSLQTTLAGAVVFAEGFAEPAADRAYLRALDLAKDLGDNDSVATLLYGFAAVLETRGDHPGSEALLNEALGVKGIEEDSRQLLEVHELMACSLFHQGSFAAALDEADRGLSFHTHGHQHPLAAYFGEHPAVASHDWAGLALWCLGYPDRALERIRTALELASAPGLEYSLASARIQAARLHHLRGEPDLALDQAEAALALASERGLTYHAGVAQLLLGWAMAALGRHDEGLARLEEGLAAHRASGAEIDRPYFLALLAEACHAAGRPKDGLSALDVAIGMLEADRSFFYEAELHRLTGELTLGARGAAASEDAAASFRRALAIARDQHARSLELRAAVSLARLLQARGASSDAVAVLRGPNEWFDEAVDTPDIRRARALAIELENEVVGASRPSA